ncbi:hypothetical protein Hanom_Chr02g00124191 [Helianthus anomalus]
MRIPQLMPSPQIRVILFIPHFISFLNHIHLRPCCHHFSKFSQNYSIPTHTLFKLSKTLAQKAQRTD